MVGPRLGLDLDLVCCCLGCDRFDRLLAGSQSRLLGRCLDLYLDYQRRFLDLARDRFLVLEERVLLRHLAMSQPFRVLWASRSGKVLAGDLTAALIVFLLMAYVIVHRCSLLLRFEVLVQG